MDSADNILRNRILEKRIHYWQKYDPSGTKQWTKQLGTTESDLGIGVTTDPSVNIYVTGYTKGGLDGNANSGGIRCYIRSSCKDIFLIKFNSSGTKHNPTQ